MLVSIAEKGKVKKQKKVITLCSCGTDKPGMPGRCVIHGASTESYLEQELEDGYSFYLEGKVLQALHCWRCTDLNTDQKVHHLKQAMFWTDKLIEDVKKHAAAESNIP